VYSVFTGEFKRLRENENEEMVCSRDSGFDTRNHFGSIIGVGAIYELRRFNRCAAKFVTQHDNRSFAASSSA